MTEKWYPVQRLDGQFGAHQDFRFDPSRRKELMAIVGKYPNAEEFIFTVAFMIGSAKAFKSHAENCQPAIVRDRLRDIKESADDLLDQLTKLDDLSKDLIESSAMMDFQQFADRSKKICTVAESALLLAGDLSNKPEDVASKHLACDVASAIIIYFNKKLTNGHGALLGLGNVKEGFYAKCLRVALRAAEFNPPVDLYPLCKEGISRLNRLGHKSQLCDNSEFETGID